MTDDSLLIVTSILGTLVAPPLGRLAMTQTAGRHRDDAGFASTERPVSAGVGYRLPRPESARARRERVGGEILHEYGDEEALYDPLPF